MAAGIHILSDLWDWQKSSSDWTQVSPPQARVALHLLGDELGLALGNPQRQLPVPPLLLQDGLTGCLLLTLRLQLQLHLHLSTAPWFNTPQIKAQTINNLSDRRPPAAAAPPPPSSSSPPPPASSSPPSLLSWGDKEEQELDQVGSNDPELLTRTKPEAARDGSDPDTSVTLR